MHGIIYFMIYAEKWSQLQEINCGAAVMYFFFFYTYYFTIYLFIGYQSVKLVLQGLWILPESKVWYEVFLSI